MSRSYRTDPAKVIAKRRMPTAFTECRIIERKPAPGDIHPLTARHLRQIVRGIYKRYFYGLKAIELFPRPGKIGEPYGLYLNDEKVVRLYSVPYPEWRFDRQINDGHYESHGAEVSSTDDGSILRWPAPVDLAYYMYREVLLHELGHHYHNRYRTKRPHPRTPAAKEASAERHAKWLSRLAAFQGWHEAEGTVLK